MFLSEIHDQLCAGELSKLHDGDGETLAPNSLPKINSLIAAGLNDLNKHFSLREKDLVVSTKIGKTVYELTPENAVSSSNPYAFILDSREDPFVGDIMQIIGITDTQGNNLWGRYDTVPVNPDANIYANKTAYLNNAGIVLQSHNTFKLAPEREYGDLLVTYKARVKPFDTSLNPEDTFIDVPDHFMNALVLYVASRKFNPMGAETIGRGMFHEGNNYWTKYQEEIQTLKANMASIGSTGENTNFQRGGWV